MLVSRMLVATAFPIAAAITHGLEPELLTLVRFALATALFAPFVILQNRGQCIVFVAVVG